MRARTSVALIVCLSFASACKAGSDAPGPREDAAAPAPTPDDAGARDGARPTGSRDARADVAESEGGGPGPVVQVDPSGSFRIAFAQPAWTFSGTVGAPATTIATDAGTDGVGAYHEVTFAFTDSSAKTASMRAYDGVPAVVLTETYLTATPNAGAPFPTFRSYPALPHHVSYGDTEFAPVSFDTLTADSPFVFFDDDANTFILSAASDFMNAATALTAGGALSSGIAFLGDQGKYVSLGKKRIASMTDDGTLSVALSFAAGETGVTVHGYAAAQPSASATVGSAGAVAWDAATGLFSVPVTPSGGAAAITLR